MGKGGGKGKMGSGKGRGSMGTEPTSPVKQRGLYTEFLGDVSDGLRQEAVQGPDVSLYNSMHELSANWDSKIRAISGRVSREPSVDQSLDVKLTRTTEPKLQLAYKTEPGQPPRQVLLEREKRFYAEQDLEELLRQEGVDFSHGGDPGGEEFATSLGLPLELFDNTEFDSRTPEDWEAMGKAEDKGVPSKVLWANDDEAPGSSWVEGMMLGYDPETTTYSVARISDGAEKRVPRLEVCFGAENPFDFARRVRDAFARRKEAEEVLQYNLFVDAMPSDDLPPLDQGQLSRMLASAMSTKGLANAETELDVAGLMQEVNLDYMRAQSKFVLDAAAATAVAAEEQGGEEGVVDSIFKKVIIPESEQPSRPAAPEQGCVRVENEGFLDKVSDFTFASFLTQPKVVTLLTKVRDECNWVLASSPLRSNILRSVKLTEWTQVQSQATTALTTELQDKWSPTCRNHMQRSLNDVGKGWFNIHEQNRDIYEFSKLKRLMRVVKQTMEDTLRFMVEDTVQTFASFIEDACAGDVEITDAKTVAPEDTRTYPLFVLELVAEETEEGGLAYNVDPEAYVEAALEAYDEALVATGTIEGVEHQVMAHLLKNNKSMLETVSATEELPTACRERIETALREWLPVADDYLAKYDKYSEFVKSSIQSHVDALSGEDVPLNQIKQVLDYHVKRTDEVVDELPARVGLGLFEISTAAVRQRLSDKHKECVAALQQLVADTAAEKCNAIVEEMNDMCKGVRKPARNPEHAQELRQYMKDTQANVANLQPAIRELPAYYDLLDEFLYELPDEFDKLKWMTYTWPKKMDGEIERSLVRCDEAEMEFQNIMLGEQQQFEKEILSMNNVVVSYAGHTDLEDLEKIAAETKKYQMKLTELDEKSKTYNTHEAIFGLEQTDYTQVGKIVKDFDPFNKMWGTADKWTKHKELWMSGPLTELDAESIEKEVNDDSKLLVKTAKAFSMREDGAGCVGVCDTVRQQMEDFKPTIPLLLALCNPGMRDRHWDKLSEDIGTVVKPDKSLTLEHCMQLNLLDHIETIEKIGDIANKEYTIEQALQKMYGEWEGVELELKPYRETGTMSLLASEEMIQQIDDQITMTQAIGFSPFKGVFEQEIADWDRKLNTVSEVIDEWLACQRNWQYLQPIFSSDDIQKQLPLEATRFQTVDSKWRKNMKEAVKNPGVVEFASNEKLLVDFQESNKLLDLVSKGLGDYLETKRAGFARFYFLSNDELLEILSQTKDPRAVQPHLKKCFEAVASLTFEDDLAMTQMHSPEGEVVDFASKLYPKGNVEDWLTQVEIMMQRSVRLAMSNALEAYYESARADWVREHAAMCVINGSQYFWTLELEDKITTSQTEGVKQYYQQALDQITDLINLVRGELTKQQRMSIGALIVVEVHARDVVAKLVKNEIKATTDFDWVSQMRYYWELREGNSKSSCPDPTGCTSDKDAPDLWIKLVQACQYYGYEYLGNSFRLVITPLTDRCYMTLMGAMYLDLGGAPAGPAGTGKTETTKDLAKALAKMCVVFNCSDSLDYKAMGKFFKGLASAGAWACFDEFNRIDIEVLSVIAQQMITIVAAIKNRQKRFLFEGCDIVLKDSFAVFITMNPGYAGRTELPDNLQALFRPMSMMVPDYGLIGEIMFISFGFGDAQRLGRTMVATFRLCSEQLSSQSHYDYGMRAVKTVIVAGGRLKAEEPDESEEMLLLRALVDVNVPKFLSMDLPLFAGIIKDLFPTLDTPEIDNGKLEVAMREAIRDQGLQEHHFLITKVIELYMMTLVRHGMMLVGPTGGGKTKCYKTLQQAMGKLREEEDFEAVKTFILNPKSITMGQLYGQFDDITHEWSDGIVANGMRDFVVDTSPEKKWIMFDGPVDAIWIENMNTVLDDNKKLCLNSGEIIKMSEEMTMMFEVEDLAVASPATVSRCGMIYMEPRSLGLDVLVKSWIQYRLPEAAKQHGEQLQKLFDDYLDPCIFWLRRNIEEPVPTVDNNLCMSCLNVMDCYMNTYIVKEGIDEPLSKHRLDQLAKTIEPMFLFAFTWSLGCTGDLNGREKFDKWFRGHMQEKGVQMPFPDEGMVYDYVLDTYSTQDGKANPDPQWVNWLDTRPEFEMPKGAEFQDMIIPTKDSICYTYLFDILANNQKMCLHTGVSGTGKTVNIMRYLQQGLNPSKQMPLTLTFSAQTSANMTQDILDGKMDKRRKGVFGPPAGKQYIILVDDLNMPKKEEYGAQPPIELLRQWADHGGWFDRKTLTFMGIVDLIWVAAMGPPGGGRQPVTNRYMRHFNIIGYTALKNDSMELIFNTIMTDFLKNQFPEEVTESGPNVISATTAIYRNIEKELLPTPEKSHYTFNLRDMSKVIQGMLGGNNKCITSKNDLLILWVHECRRVFQDRMINNKDRSWFEGQLQTLMAEHFDTQWKDVFPETDLIFYGDYSVPGMDPKFYDHLDDMDKLIAVMNEYLEDYNAQSSAPMPLILFTDAMQHVSRICRVIRQPMGNALLLGVGGSGRQSLTKLAAFMAEYELFKIEVAKGYGMNEWREDLKTCLKMAGVEGKSTVFLFVDTQIVMEAFVEDLNNILNTGEVPNLMSAPEDQDAIATSARPICAAKGLQANKMNFDSVFISQVRKNLHMVLAMSPIGDVFRDRLRNFPSLVNCCTIDWFAEWPEQALTSVAKSTLDGVELSEESLRDGLAAMVMYVHKSVEEVSAEYFDTLKRKNYVTPTSYLELLSTYEKMLATKREEVGGLCQRLSIGLDKIISTEEMVGVMQEELVALQPVLEKTQKEVADMMVVIKEDTEAANEVKAVVAADEAAAETKAAECKAIADDAQADLDEALPALDKALKSLELLSKSDIDEVKSLGKPPEGVRTVISATCIMFEIKPKKVPAPDGRGKVDDYWDVGKGLLKDSNKFLKSLFDYDKENIPEKVIKKITEYVENDQFTPEVIAKVSKACTAICQWVHAMYTFHNVNNSIEPKREALASSQAELKVTMDGLAVTKAKLAEVVAKLDELDRNYKEAVAKQDELAAKVETCEGQMGRAQQLLGGLGGEKIRWQATVEKLNSDYVKLQGDVAVAAGSVAYLGPFTASYRDKITSMWRAKLKALGIPSNDGASLLTVQMDPVAVRGWALQGLPSDNVSIENAIIVTTARRWPLMIDPQLQGNKWIRNMEKETLDQIKLTDKDYLRTLENAIRFGRSILLENVLETLDAALEPVLGKQTFKQRGTEMIKLGDSIVPYHEDFKFYMTTKLANPHYAPEVSVKVSLLNMMITMEGLQEQLVNVVVEQERADLATKRGELVVSMAKMKKDMQDIEDEILHLLANSTGNILDDVVLINTLSASKVTSEDIKVKVEAAEVTTAEIAETSKKYIPVAYRASILFFCISNLNNVDPMYEYSLGWFMNLFIKSIQNSEPNEDLPARVININEFFTYSLYCNVCRSLFEAHKLLFSFLVSIRILQGYKEIDSGEWGFLLKGASSIETKHENPASAWITEQSWIEISNVAKLPAFAGLDDDFVGNLDEFKAIFDSPTAHEDPLPCGWNDKLNSFQKMVFCRTLRPDKVIEAAQLFITEKFGQKFIEPPAFDLPACFEDATNMTPLIFVLSVGADPMADLVAFATEMKMNKKLNAISLGQGQGPIAASMIEEGMERGTWVLLQNCHLAKSWMTAFDKIVEDFTPDKMHRDFRLWLSAMPSPIFPVAVLQNGVKMTLEPPKGLKANVRKTFLGFKQQKLEESSQPRAWRKLLFSIAFFHALVLDRRQFGPLGWNIRYAFSDMDLACCVEQIHDFIDEYEDIPYKVMLILCGDVNYGGRVTDDKDRRSLMSILDQYITPDVMDDDYKFSKSGTYYIPESGEGFEQREHYTDYLSTLPVTPAPEVFGLNENAAITCLQNEMLDMFSTVMSLEGAGGGGGGDEKTPEEIVFDLCDQYLSTIPTPLNEEDVYNKYPTDYNECMNTVLMQEVTRYNKVLEVIHESCAQLKLAIGGFVVMSSELEKAFRSINNNQVPDMWQDFSYPNLKPLAAWVNDLLKRMEFVQSWYDDGAPGSYWISGFFFPQAFLTSTRQNYARQRQLPVDTIDYDYIVKDDVEWGEIKEKPDPEVGGCFIYGIYVEGAIWDYEEHCLAEPRPKELFSTMPSFWLKPVQNREEPTHEFRETFFPDPSGSYPDDETRTVYQAPLYKILTRAGVLLTTGHSTNYVMNMEVSSKQPQDYWIRAGVAMFLALR